MKWGAALCGGSSLALIRLSPSSKGDHVMVIGGSGGVNPCCSRRALQGLNIAASQLLQSLPKYKDNDSQQQGPRVSIWADHDVKSSLCRLLTLALTSRRIWYGCAPVASSSDANGNSSLFYMVKVSLCLGMKGIHLTGTYILQRGESRFVPGHQGGRTAFWRKSGWRVSYHLGANVSSAGALPLGFLW